MRYVILKKDEYNRDTYFNIDTQKFDTTTITLFASPQYCLQLLLRLVKKGDINETEIDKVNIISVNL